MSQPHLVDTSTLSLFLRRQAGSRYPKLVSRVREIADGEGLCIAHVTVYEVLRGLLKDKSRGESVKKLARFEMLLSELQVVGLDEPAGHGWRVAAQLWAAGQAKEPAITMAEADLQIVATAQHHGRTLVTSDQRLAMRLGELGAGDDVELLPLE